jgi:hypothetical protein
VFLRLISAISVGGGGEMQGRSSERSDYRNTVRELVVRNERLAMEVAKLQEINRNIRTQLQAAIIANLRLSNLSKKVEQATQTQEHSSRGEGHAHDPHRPAQQRKESKRVRSHRRSSAEFDFTSANFDDIGAPVRSPLMHLPVNLMNDRRTFSPVPARRNGGITNDELIGNENNAPSPIQARVTAALSQRLSSVGSPSDPQRPGAVSEEEEPKSTRSQRSVRKPVSYQEPSLRVKVRKGFKFFRF